jgi:hypothetical protein
VLASISIQHLFNSIILNNNLIFMPKKSGETVPFLPEVPITPNPPRPGFPTYSVGDDVYHIDLIDKTVSPDALVQRVEDIGYESVEQDTQSGPTVGDDLDVPGAELDDADEVVGEEDEENNYYSVGGDNHNNLEEDNS